MNLVINASEAIGDAPGLVGVSTSARDLDPPTAAGLWVPGESVALEAGRFVVLEIRDTGAGMDEDTKTRIFEPFFSTKLAGRGLGLATVEGIVRRHRGALRVESTPGKGTRFSIFFPASAVTRRVHGKSLAPHLHGEGTVMIVDDERHVRTAAARILEHCGFRTLSAANGREGVELFLAHAESIDVVLLDMTMPDLDGKETFFELRKRRPDVRIILSSGFDEIEAKQRFSATGFVDFLQKPYSAGDLAEKIRGALNFDVPSERRGAPETD
jgi:CheY-like chemotaxis protein